MLDVGGGIGLLNLITGAGQIIYIIYMYIIYNNYFINLFVPATRTFSYLVETSAQLYFSANKTMFFN